jgi:drug/metabolite transporter (DMT)-like permease
VFVLASVLLNLGYQLLSRVLAASENTFALLFYTALAGSIALRPRDAVVHRGPRAEPARGRLFASLGVFGGVGHFMFTAAFRHAPASLIAPLNYLQLLWPACWDGWCSRMSRRQSLLAWRSSPGRGCWSQ